MPNQNNPSKQSPLPIISPQSDLPPLPPTFQEVKTVTKTVAEPTSFSAGSAAPMPSTPPIISSKPVKKFGGGRIIATLLGILLLVGGVGSGLLLTQQQQIFQPKAGCGGCPQGSHCNAAGTFCVDNHTGQGLQNPTVTNNSQCSAGTHLCQCAAGSGCTTALCSAYCGNPSATTPPNSNGTGGTEGGTSGGSTTCTAGQTKIQPCVASNGCPGDQTVYCNNGQWCTGTGGVACFSVCSPKAGECAATCNPNTQVWNGTACVNKNGTATEANSCSGTGSCIAGGVSGTCINGACVTSSTSCKTGDPNAPGCCATQSCSNIVCETGPLGSRTECKLPTGQHCTLSVGSSCQGNTGNNTTEQTASCQAVKAYSSAWAILSATQLSALSPGTSVNFCVTGTTTGGSFDKAKFTINNVAGAEITTKGQGAAANAFCTASTIAAGSTTVRAIIHHATLGWSN